MDKKERPIVPLENSDIITAFKVTVATAELGVATNTENLGCGSGIAILGEIDKVKKHFGI